MFFHTPYGVLSRAVRSSSLHRTEFSRVPYGVMKDSVRCNEGLRTV
ncbi:MAG: hypothetical protein RR346_01755 [Bacteroidales bacterium]